MKGSAVKVACLFIIAMYCLAPLSAVDLNPEHNNTKYISHDTDSDIKVKDVNVTDNNKNQKNKNADGAQSGDIKDKDTQNQVMTTTKNWIH